MSEAAAAPLLHSLPDAAARLGGIGRSTLYELIAAGAIRTVKIGRRAFVSERELARYVAALEEETP